MKDAGYEGEEREMMIYWKEVTKEKGESGNVGKRKRGCSANTRKRERGGKSKSTRGKMKKVKKKESHEEWISREGKHSRESGRAGNRAALRDGA